MANPTPTATLFSQDLKKAIVHNQKVLVRVDLNVPLKDGVILDINRLKAIVPTVQYLRRQKAKVILLSHLGRPKGPETDLSLAPLAGPLSELLDHTVTFCPDLLGDVAKQSITSMNPGGVLLLENLRFHPEEETNDPLFAKALADIGDVYVNDGFAVSHRAHASVLGITDYLPSYPGLLMQQEVSSLSTIFSPKAFPVMAIIGGSKISTKINLLESLIKRMKTLAIGGGIANTFLAAQGYAIGNSLQEPGEKETALRIMIEAKKEGCTLILPQDVAVARDLTPSSEVSVVSLKDIHPSESIFDIGPKTIEKICAAIERSKTVLWNGPLGLFEHRPFDRSSLQIAQNMAHLTTHGRLQSIAGGGETIAVIKRACVDQAFTYLSTGGGAFLEYIEGRDLPGVSALLQQPQTQKAI